jgi:ribulose-phosphate 3-epimerase
MVCAREMVRAVTAAFCMASAVGFMRPANLATARRAGKATRTAAQSGRGRSTSMKIPGGYLIAPSILSADFARLGEEVDNVLAAGADVVHFDVMDNHYVPNLTIGPMVCKALRDHGVTAPIDVHLMVSPVDRIVGDFADAGASYITFHPEATNHVDRTLQLIRSRGCKAGLVFNPATSLDYAKYVLDKVDIILLMSVNPGFGGQSFIPATLQKLKEARKMIDESGYDIRLEVRIFFLPHSTRVKRLGLSCLDDWACLRYVRVRQLPWVVITDDHTTRRLGAPRLSGPVPFPGPRCRRADSCPHAPPPPPGRWTAA